MVQATKYMSTAIAFWVIATVGVVLYGRATEAADNLSATKIGTK